jgi:hypothetical protein
MSTNTLARKSSLLSILIHSWRIGLTLPWASLVLGRVSCPCGQVAPVGRCSKQAMASEPRNSRLEPQQSKGADQELLHSDGYPLFGISWGFCVALKVSLRDPAKSVRTGLRAVPQPVVHRWSGVCANHALSFSR